LKKLFFEEVESLIFEPIIFSGKIDNLLEYDAVLQGYNPFQRLNDEDEGEGVYTNKYL